MKKILSICAIALLFASCSNDDDNQGEFFNLKEGNLWVYKHYTVREDGSETFSGTDTIKVIGQETIEDKVYFKLSHSKPRGDEYEYRRVNDNGHLVNEEGIVIHPGVDLGYQQNFMQEYGELKYSMENPKEINVEGQNYNVYPYIAHLIPNEGSSVPQGIGNYRYYKPGLGMVLDGARFVAGNTYIEDRLVHYELK